MSFNGWIILDKPSGITSAHAVAKVKRFMRPSKVGHAGTLDPLASGILPLAIGEATKTVQYMQEGAKAYGFTVTWGQERDTDDSEGQVTGESALRPTREQIEALLINYIGKIQQVPPNYSAIKMDGKRAYDMAREGQEIVMKSREIEVHSLTVEDYEADKTSFICHCGKGTYIRSLARDMGRALGCLGYISVLRRLKVASFTENHAISLEQLEKMVHKGDLSFLRPVESALDDILAWDVSPDQAVTIRRGQLIPSGNLPAGIPVNTVMLARCEGKAVAICQLLLDSVKPVRVFNL